MGVPAYQRSSGLNMITKQEIHEFIENIPDDSPLVFSLHAEQDSYVVPEAKFSCSSLTGRMQIIITYEDACGHDGLPRGAKSVVRSNLPYLETKVIKRVLVNRDPRL